MLHCIYIFIYKNRHTYIQEFVPPNLGLDFSSHVEVSPASFRLVQQSYILVV